MKPSALVAEFIGAFTLCFIGFLSLNSFGTDVAGLTGVGLCFGLSIGIMVTALGPVSGGHFNPAVSIAFFFLKKIEGGPLVGYILAQIAGGAVASVLVQLLVSDTALKAGVPALSSTTQVWQGMGLEAIATFFLMLTVLGTAVDPRAPKMGGLFVGLVIAIGIIAIGPLTGGALNPARYLGPALISGNFTNALVWLVGPTVGALLAAVVYSSLFEEKAKEKAK